MKKLFVGNLSFDTSESELAEMFEQIGSVESVQVIKDRDTGRSKGFAFVQMANDALATQAKQQLNGFQMKGRPLTVNDATPITRRESSSPSISGFASRDRGYRDR
jgi:RNA recognition motif-containing protein